MKPISDEGETLEVPLPSKLHVLVFPSIDGGWRLKLSAITVDVDTKLEGYFGTSASFAEKPTREQIAVELDRWLAHEVREQLGLEPHGKEIAIQ